MPPLTPVLFTDAYDVILRNDSAGLAKLAQWLSLHPGSALFAAEKAKWPDKDAFYPVPLQDPFPYLNSGVFFGYAQTLLKLLESKPYDARTDDQRFYTELFLGGAPIVLDHAAEYFLCMHDADDQIIHESKALVLHLNNGVSRIKRIRDVVKREFGANAPQLKLANAVVWKCIQSGLSDAWKRYGFLFAVLCVLALVWMWFM